LARDLRDLMQSGQLQPGDRLPSYPEMKLRGLGQNTVDRAHSMLELEGLIERRNGRGVFVAAPKKRISTGIIGFWPAVINEVDSSFYWSQLVAGIRSTAGESGRSVLLLHDEEARSAGFWDSLEGVVISGREPDVENILRYLPAGIPIAVILSEVPDVNRVLPDDFGGAHAATRHLLDLGHRRIGCLLTRVCPVAERRLAGYSSALEDAGIEPALRWVRRFVNGSGVDSATVFQESGQREMRDWLRGGWQATGLTALVAQVPLLEIGARATSMVMDQIEGKITEVTQELMPVTLRVGLSTAPLKPAHGVC